MIKEVREVTENNFVAPNEENVNVANQPAENVTSVSEMNDAAAVVATPIETKKPKKKEKKKKSASLVSLKTLLFFTFSGSKPWW